MSDGADVTTDGSRGPRPARVRHATAAETPAVGPAAAPERPAVWHRFKKRFSPLHKLERRLSALRDIARLKKTDAFDPDWYEAAYPEITRTGLSPLVHYVRKGAWEGRRPRADFDPLFYLSMNRAVAASGVEPFTHYLLSGRRTDPTLATESRALTHAAVRGGRKRERGWYGAAALTRAQVFPGPRAPGFAADAAALPARTPHSDDSGADWLMRLGPVELLQEHILTRTAAPDVPPSPPHPSLSIVTVFDGDRAAFARTAGWIGVLLAHARTAPVPALVEWIVVNGDPACAVAEIEAAFSHEVRAATRLLPGGAWRGSAEGRNAALAEARGDFVVHLPPGEILAPDALALLSHYARTFPLCRCICPGRVELDRNDAAIRRCDPPLGAADLVFQADSGEPVAFLRADLCAALGGFDPRFSGGDTYDLVLRAASREPILAIPEPVLGRRAGPLPRSEGAKRARSARADAIRRLVDATWPEQRQPAAPRAPVVHGLCLVRTQGRRPDLLAEALGSIYRQSEPLTAAVIVHADAATFAEVQRTAPRKEGRTLFLHAPDTSRRRGHPWNVGLDHLAANAQAYQYLCLLDDDDIYYPLFASRMVEGFRLTGADVVYALVNRRPLGGAPEPAHMPLPASCLVAGNFIPTNSYAVRTDVLLESGVRALEDVDYFEDWDFLVSLLAADCRFHLIPEAVGEFLLIGDGNAPSKRDPAHHALCLARVQDRGRQAAARRGIGRFYRDLMDFDFHNPAIRHPSPGGHLILAKMQFLRSAAAHAG
ncbi:hypothetical protein [Aquabacter spiritensis]|uniref:Glycosyl transferase family 2 n=1 Tax=Aquabacter spiritensis TaxID=933073 RepID=A0A4R3M1N9_9HYPH|nr:hypothetical protein [Aquabacter spiritensis]TCT06912.1 hypothetical protein EDC64_102393 [Aquabacter spiritensis]